jgi:hypothetical protein
MDDVQWERYAALGGIAFVVLNVIGAFLPGAPPSTDDSAHKIGTYFADHSGGIKGAAILMGLGVIGLVWWFGSLWRRMAAAEDGRPRIAIVATVALAAGGALALSSGAVTAAVALDRGELGDGAKPLYVLSFVLIAMAGFMLVAHIAAVTSLSYRTRMFAPGVNIVGWIAAALFLASTLGMVSTASAFGFVGLAGFLAWCLWIVLISVDMWRHAATPVAS